MSASLFDEIRSASATVMRKARSVRIDPERLAGLGEELLNAPPPPADFDPGHQRVDGDAATLAFVITLNAINFGSGYFPYLAKRVGQSGYLTVSTRLRERFASEGPWTAAELCDLDAEQVARVLNQDIAVPEVTELMELFARALGGLGRLLEERHGGRFEGLVESAEGSGEALVDELATIPFYRDVVQYDGMDVPFYKRAQITVADLAIAFEGRGYGAFRDLEELTIFADNLVPHVLRRKGVLVYDDALARRIESGELIPSGAPEEVEIRAGAVDAVERCVAGLRASGADITPHKVDTLLWTTGQSPEMKAHPRHRTRTTFY